MVEVRLSEVEMEMMLGIYNLRYLTLDQIHEGWFSERSRHACEVRLSRLVGRGWLDRANVGSGGYGSALRLGARGLSVLRSMRASEFSSYGALSPLYLPHLLDTNAVFLALAKGEWRSERLPFVWRGSHRARFEFEELGHADCPGGFARRARQLAADALVSPRRGEPGPRCFLELDRCTEGIGEAPGRVTITSKLKAYRVFLRQALPPDNLTAYERKFARAPRAPRLVFVVASADAHRRRCRSIAEVAAEALPHIDVRCVPLVALDEVRAALLSSAPGAAPSRRRTLELTHTSLGKLEAFHARATLALRRTPLGSERDRHELASLADAAGRVLARAQDGESTDAT